MHMMKERNVFGLFITFSVCLVLFSLSYLRVSMCDVKM